MQRVTSQGGQVQFPLPDHWRAEEDGTGMLFYDPREGSGTLRISVLTFETPGHVDASQVLNDRSLNKQVAIETLPNGFSYVTWTEKGSEDGVATITRNWQFAAVEGRFLTMPVVSFTLDEASADDPLNFADLTVVKQAMLGLEFVP